MTNLLDLERRLREAVEAIPAEARPLILEMLTADQERRAREIGALHAAGLTPETVERLIDCGESPTTRAVVPAGHPVARCRRPARPRPLRTRMAQAR